MLVLLLKHFTFSLSKRTINDIFTTWLCWCGQKYSDFNPDSVGNSQIKPCGVFGCKRKRKSLQKLEFSLVLTADIKKNTKNTKWPLKYVKLLQNVHKMAPIINTLQHRQKNRTTDWSVAHKDKLKVNGIKEQRSNHLFRLELFIKAQPAAPSSAQRRPSVTIRTTSSFLGYQRWQRCKKKTGAGGIRVITDRCPAAPSGKNVKDKNNRMKPSQPPHGSGEI